MALNRISDEQVEQMLHDIEALGIQIQLDKDLQATLSGYYLGGRFSFCWLKDSEVAFLKSEKVQYSYAPFEDPLVTKLSEMIGFTPFCTYRNPNYRGFQLFEWKPENDREDRVHVLASTKEVSGLRTYQAIF